MHFTDVDPVVLDVERIVDSTVLGPPPAPGTCYGSSGAMCAAARFAEPDVETAVSVS
jgi:hypothetical protein